MADMITIQRSTKPMYVYGSIAGVLGLFSLIFATVIFNAFNDMVSSDTTILTRLARWIIVGGVVIVLLIIRAQATKLKYSATPQNIIVQNKLFGARKKKYYAISSVTSVSLEQSYLGSYYGYGNISIRMDRLGNTEQLVLSNVENPEHVLQSLQRLVNHIKN